MPIFTLPEVDVTFNCAFTDADSIIEDSRQIEK
jgi:hypothetical protein